MIAAAQHSAGRETLLLPDRDEPYGLVEVYEKLKYGLRDEIILDFGDCFLQFGVNPDTDSIVPRFHGRKFASRRGYRSVGGAAPWSRYLGEECGWTWLAINQQGYWDTALISFDAVIPNILLNVMASSLYVCAIGPLDTIVASTGKSKSKKETAKRR